MSILNRFEARALHSIEIDASIKCDNYDSVGRLKLINTIRKTVAAAYRNLPQNPNYTLDDLLSKGRIIF